MKFLDLKYEAFGLDINDLSLKIIKLKKKRKGFVLTSYNEARIAPGIIEDGVIKKEDSLARIIREACSTVKGKKLKTKYVVASLPEEKSFLQVIQMPRMAEEELKTAVPFEAENYIPLPIDDVYLDYQVIRPAKDYFNHLEVLIVATPKKIVDSYVSCFKKAGLEPIALEVESQSIARALIKKENNPLPIILVDLDGDNTDFVVFSGNSIRFTCSIPISCHSLEDKSSLQDLTCQIEKYIDFYRDHSSYEHPLSDGKIEKILLCGEGSELKGMSSFMSKCLGIPVELGDPFSKSSFKKISFTAAMGLALREVNNL